MLERLSVKEKANYEGRENSCPKMCVLVEFVGICPFQNVFKFLV